MNGRRFLVCALTMLCTATASAQGRGGGPSRPAPPAPRWPDGTINLGAVPGTSGLWDGAEPLATIPKNYERVAGRPRPGLVDLKDVPIQPWAQALLDARHARFLADEPYTRCKPSPAARSFGTAYGVELLNLPGTHRIYLFQTGGAHSYRVIYMDGRTHPVKPEPSAFGHSIGWWDGDTLVIDTVGIDESAWLERWGLTNRPHGDTMNLSDRCAEMFRTGASVVDVLKLMRGEGLSQIASIRALIDLKGISLREAKEAVHTSPVWADVRDDNDEFHAELEKTVHNASESEPSTD